MTATLRIENCYSCPFFHEESVGVWTCTALEDECVDSEIHNPEVPGENCPLREESGSIELWEDSAPY